MGGAREGEEPRRGHVAIEARLGVPRRREQAAHKAAQLVQASYDTPAPKTAKADRSIEFGECLLFEDKLATSAQAKLIGGPRAGVIGGFQAEDAKLVAPQSTAVAVRR